jgi:hypothetical protein
MPPPVYLIADEELVGVAMVVGVVMVVLVSLEATVAMVAMCTLLHPTPYIRSNLYLFYHLAVQEDQGVLEGLGAEADLVVQGVRQWVCALGVVQEVPMVQAGRLELPGPEAKTASRVSSNAISSLSRRTVDIESGLFLGPPMSIRYTIACLPGSRPLCREELACAPFAGQSRGRIIMANNLEIIKSVAVRLCIAIDEDEAHIVSTQFDKLVNPIGKRTALHREGQWTVPNEVLNYAPLVVSFLSGLFLDAAKDVAKKRIIALLERWATPREPLSLKERTDLKNQLVILVEQLPANDAQKQKLAHVLHTALNGKVD